MSQELPNVPVAAQTGMVSAVGMGARQKMLMGVHSSSPLLGTTPDADPLSRRTFAEFSSSEQRAGGRFSVWCEKKL